METFECHWHDVKNIAQILVKVGNRHGKVKGIFIRSMHEYIKELVENFRKQIEGVA